MKTYEAKLELDIKTTLGEGPIWHSAQSKLYFVDIIENKVYCHDNSSSNLRHWSFNSYTSAVSISKKNNLIITEGSKIIEFDMETGKKNDLLDLNLPENIRCNEAKPDAKGRFWVGTMHIEAKKEFGAFYRIDTDLKVTKVLSNLTIPNGFCWSADQKFMFHIDSADYCVKRFDFDSETGNISNEKTILNFNPKLGIPDGMCEDSQDRLWIALWGGGKVVCFNPKTESIEAEINVPAPNVTSCIFGDKDLKTLYITTARYGLSEDELLQYPKSGALFSCTEISQGLEINKAKLKVG